MDRNIGCSLWMYTCGLLIVSAASFRGHAADGREAREAQRENKAAKAAKELKKSPPWK